MPFFLSSLSSRGSAFRFRLSVCHSRRDLLSGALRVPHRGLSSRAKQRGFIALRSRRTCISTSQTRCKVVILNAGSRGLMRETKSKDLRLFLLFPCPRFSFCHSRRESAVPSVRTLQSRLVILSEAARLHRAAQSKDLHLLRAPTRSWPVADTCFLALTQPQILSAPSMNRLLDSWMGDHEPTPESLSFQSPRRASGPVIVESLRLSALIASPACKGAHAIPSAHIRFAYQQRHLPPGPHRALY